MISFLARCKRRRAAQSATGHLYAMIEDLHGLVLAADMDYAFADPEWQEGPEGMRHYAASEKYRQAVLTLRGLDLPDVGDLG